MNDTKKTRLKPTLIKVYPSLPKPYPDSLLDIRIRVIKYPDSDRLLDIREFVTNGTDPKTHKPFTGFSNKGLCLNEDQIVFLVMLFAEVINDGMTDEQT